jgi:predicted nucleic-acid-binding Zn-ribbon protein
MCPKCERKRFREKIIKRGKRNFMVRECLGCQTQYELTEVRKSKITNAWVEVDK